MTDREAREPWGQSGEIEKERDTKRCNEKKNEKMREGGERAQQRTGKVRKRRASKSKSESVEPSSRIPQLIPDLYSLVVCHALSITGEDPLDAEEERDRQSHRHQPFRGGFNPFGGGGGGGFRFKFQ